MSAEEKYRKAREKIALLREIVDEQRRRLRARDGELEALARYYRDRECPEHCPRHHTSHTVDNGGYR